MKLKAKRFMDYHGNFYGVESDWRAEQFGQLVNLSAPFLKRKLSEGDYEKNKIIWERPYKDHNGNKGIMLHKIYVIQNVFLFDYNTQNPHFPVTPAEFFEFVSTWKRENIMQTRRDDDVVKSYGETTSQKIKRRKAENGGRYIENQKGLMDGR